MEDNGYEKLHFVVWNRVGIWEQGSTPTKNSQGYHPRPASRVNRLQRREFINILGSLFYHMYSSIRPSCLAQEKLMDAYGEETYLPAYN